MSEEVKPFKVQIPDSELELLRKKVKLARLPEYPPDTAWGEKAEGGVTMSLMRDTVQHWKTSDSIQSRCTLFMPVHPIRPERAVRSPLLFLHGWPGSFVEVQPMLPTLLEAGFDVVAPSLLGYGFSSYPRQEGLKIAHHAEALDQIMARLGYNEYVVQGGDWGWAVGRALTLSQPKRVKALHLNIFTTAKLFAQPPGWEKDLTEVEKAAVARMTWFFETNTAYEKVHTTKPRTLGYALHDSPVGMLSWMMDKLMLWSDVRDKKWTADELITWTLLHYLPGPTTGMQMYRENIPSLTQGAAAGYIKQPVGVSHFPLEIGMAPRKWAEEANIVFWRAHDRGGHFAAYEQPAALAADIIEFFNAQWTKSK